MDQKFPITLEQRLYGSLLKSWKQKGLVQVFFLKKKTNLGVGALFGR